MSSSFTQANAAAVRNQKLHRSVKSYVAAVIDLARSANNEQKFPDLASHGTFSFFYLADEIVSLPEYKDCLEKLLEDKVIASQLGVLAGRPGLARQSLDAVSLMRQLPMLGISQDHLELNETFFELEYAQFESSFYQDSLEYEVIAPLSGVSFERDIKINDTVEICRIDPTGMRVPIDEPRTRRSPFPLCGWAVWTTYTLPICIGDTDTSEQSTNAVKETRNAANARVDTVVTALRLLKAPNAAAVQKLHRTRGWVFRDQWMPPVSYQPDLFFTLDTGENFVGSLAGLWGLLASPKVLSQKHLTVAIKRFSYAHDRVDREDKIIDLLIAAEALFLSTTGNQSELKYRLRLHAALFVGSDQATRRQIFDDMGLAYDLRSSIVHGSIPDSKIDKIAKREGGRFGDKYKLLEFTDRIQEYIRFSIVRMVRQAAEGSGAIDWESIVLGDDSELKLDLQNGS